MAGLGSFHDPYIDRFHSMKSKSFDLVVIGGGINGAAAARDAALRGLKVLLLEKSDFGAGASTKTSKLAHGGLRYLEQWEFTLVKESLDERNLLLHNAPHLVHPIPFIMPVYATSPRPLWQVNIGLSLYDFFSRKSGMPKHRMLTSSEVADNFPEIERSDLTGGCFFYDAWMLDNRLVIENVLSAEQAGALVFNYAQVTGLSISQGRIDRVDVIDLITGKENSIACKAVINATGAWSDHIAALEHSKHCDNYVKPTKGIHMIIPQVARDQALLLRTPQDGRVFFVIPWGSYSLLGTTDTFYDGDPDGVKVEKNDIDYLSAAFKSYFPNMAINDSSIVATFAGLRPLAAQRNHAFSPSGASRSHAIEVSDRGLISVLGGKFTTHRRVAEDAVDRSIALIGAAGQFRPCSTHKTPLPGASDSSSLEHIAHELSEEGLDRFQVEHLLSNYGRLSLRILEIIRSDSSERRQICPEHPHVFAEITYAIQNEHARKLEDWFCRRTSIAYTSCRGDKCLGTVASKFASLLGWDRAQREIEETGYLQRC